MGSETYLKDLTTYHLHGLPFEKGAECIVSETANEFFITCGEENASISKRTIIDIYIEVETKQVQTDEIDPVKTILHTMFLANRAFLDDRGPIKKIDKYEFENLVIISKTVGKTEEISLRIPVERWKAAEDMVRDYEHKKR